MSQPEVHTQDRPNPNLVGHEPGVLRCGQLDSSYPADDGLAEVARQDVRQGGRPTLLPRLRDLRGRQHRQAGQAWWLSVKTIDDTALIPRAVVEQELREGQAQEWVDQEYY